MKTLLVAIFLTVLSSSVVAQSNDTTSVSIKAAGLTCSMCSKAIYKSLLKVHSVSKVEPDIKNSSYTVFFKKDHRVSIAALTKAVEDAGFSIASIKVNTSKKKE